MITWCMLPDICSATDIIFCHFGPFFALLPHYWFRKLKFGKNVKSSWIHYHFTYVYHKWRSYDVWFLRYKAWRTEFFVILGHFLPFDPPNNPKNQNFEQMKKVSGGIIILHMCTINENHMMHSSWDMEHNRQKLFSFWTLFCPFTPLTTHKIKILKNERSLKISSFYTSVLKIMIMCYTVPEIWHVTDVIVIFHFGLFLAFLSPLPPNSPKNQWKKCLEISSLYTTVPKIVIICYTVPEIWLVTDLIAISHFRLCFVLLPP